MPSEINIYEEQRPWGAFRQFTHNAPTTVKLITVKPGEVLSLQSHKLRSEFWHVVSGSGTIEIGDAKHEAVKGGEFDIPVETKHRVSAGADGMEFLEIASGTFDESDIIRYEDKYGRA